MSAEGTQQYSQPFSTVFESCKTAAVNSKMKIKEEDVRTGYLKCSGKSDFRTMYGEKIKIHVSQMGQGVQVHIKAKTSGPVITSFGKNDETIRKFFEQLNYLLSQPQGGGQGQAQGQTQAQGAQHCNRCGLAIRYVQEYQRWYCDNCQQYL
jgi:hypothetical protein